MNNETERARARAASTYQFSSLRIITKLDLHYRVTFTCLAWLVGF